MKRALLLLVLLLGLAAGLLSAPPDADVVLTNGNIYTVDVRLGRVEAIAITRGKIAAVGTTEEMQHWVGPETKVIDLEGKFVMPGFNDAHTHLANAGQGSLSVNVEGTRSVADFQERIRARLSEFEPGTWVVGRGWDHSLWEENRMPTKADLDAVSTSHPMFFTRVDGHSAVANSLALERAGITRSSEQPEGGEIVRDADGEPTGWLKENATGLVSGLIPAPTSEQRKRGLLLALAEAARYGVTSVQDNSSWEDFLALRELKQEGKLTLRVTEWLPFDAPLNRLEEMRKEGGATDPWLKTGALKGVTDGSGGSLSAAMLDPFANAPDNRGILLYDPEQLKKMVVDRDAAGFQIALHAIGDRANRVALDAFEAALKINKRRNARHKIEHAQFVHRDDFARFKELDVLASMQPCHLLADMRWAPTILGSEREYEGYAVGTMRKAGARLAFGTDYPVEHINPLRGLYAAVTREFEDGGPEGGWLPGEKVSLEEAIRAYTLGSAFAEFEERRKGTLSPGKFADLIVLSQDITNVSPPELLRTDVLLTMVGGKIVYQKEQAD
ncbi:MAG: amidohydrolase [Candidatus Acidiferrales bacterium]